jgi:hypothetical protein
VPLKHLTIIFLFIAGVKRVVTWRRRPMSSRSFAGMTPLGGLSHILPLLSPLLTTRIHPEIKDMKERSITRYGQKITRSEEVNNFWKQNCWVPDKSDTSRTSSVRSAPNKSGVGQTSLVLDNFEAKNH